MGSGFLRIRGFRVLDSKAGFTALGLRACKCHTRCLYCLPKLDKVSPGGCCV